MLKQLIFNIYR